jgi:hypothetical protein
MERKLDEALQGVLGYWATRIEGVMKTNASWTDRTSNARNGLRAQAVKDDDGEYSIVCTHSVEYGIYLETSNDARYAIIMPTITSQGPKVMQTLTKLLDRLRGMA